MQNKDVVWHGMETVHRLVLCNRSYRYITVYRYGIVTGIRYNYRYGIITDTV